MFQKVQSQQRPARLSNVSYFEIQTHGMPDPAETLNLYALGMFPIGSTGGSRSDIYWLYPSRRAVLPLDGMHVSRSLARTLRRSRFTVTADRDFQQVIDGCAARAQTWICEEIRRTMLRLHADGYAHSIEVWNAGRLVGGLYGISLGAAFLGESMFSRERDASKVALAYLVARLKYGGFELLDVQVISKHLHSLGALDIPRGTFGSQLIAALSKPAVFRAMPEALDVGRVLRLVVGGEGQRRPSECRSRG